MENLLPWFALKSVPGIGNHLFKRLIDRFKSPEHVFNASSDELLLIDGISPRLVSAIQDHAIPDQVKADMEQVIEEGYQIVPLTDTAYPRLLLQIPDPPPFLYLYGNLGNTTKSIAVVGSRSATRYGLSLTTQLCKELASLDITVVSGMARGIDTAAHDGTLKGKGKTIAVLGSGLKKIYPSENEKLFHKIAENGAVISEFHLNASPEPHHFPIRNRIISGISLGTVVVEAGKKSGALITARFAKEYRRKVFAIPGNIFSFKSQGPHYLIKQGAKLVTNAQDILEELPDMIKSHLANKEVCKNDIFEKLPPLTSEEESVFKSLGPDAIHIDDLMRKTAMDSGKLSSILLQLELKGIVEQLPGKLFSVAVKNLF